MSQLTVLFLLAFAIGTLALEGDRIVGGQEAGRGQFPHQASLRLSNGTRHFCGGAIISDRYVLSSAHCTQGRNSAPINVQVAVGAHRRSDAGILHIVLRIVNHPRYNARRIENDISVIHTVQRIIFGPNVRAIRLPTRNVPVANGVALTVSGWGQTRVSILSFSSSAPLHQ